MGMPVPTQKLKEAQRKVRRQWDKFQKLRGAGKQFSSDEEAVDLIYQVVGAPSADFGRVKGKTRPARPRSTSAGRRKKAGSPAEEKRRERVHDSAEEKENGTINGVNQNKKNETSRHDKKRVPIESGHGKAGDIETTIGKGGSKESLSDATAEEQVRENGIEEKEEEITGGRAISIDIESLAEAEEDRKAKDSVSDSLKESRKPTEGRQLGKIEGARKVSEAEQSGRPDNAATEHLKTTVLENGKEVRDPVIDRRIHESTDSGIESAVSRSYRRLKDKEMRDTSSDGQSIGVEARSNEDSAGDSVLSQLKTKSEEQKGLTILSVVEQDATENEKRHLTAQTRMQTHDNGGTQNHAISSPLPSGASSMGDENKTPAKLVHFDSSTIEDDSGSALARAENTERAAQTTNGQNVPSSDKPQGLPVTTRGAGNAMEDIAGVTVSIVPPSLASPHRRSIDVTALLGIPLVHKTVEVGADATTRKGVPSRIHEEWRKKEKAEQLMGVLSGTSKLVYLGSAKTSPVSGPQIDVINTTEEDAERLGLQTASLRAAGSDEEPAASEANGEGQDAGPVFQCLDWGGSEMWKSPTNAVET